MCRHRQMVDSVFCLRQALIASLPRDDRRRREIPGKGIAKRCQDFAHQERRGGVSRRARGAIVLVRVSFPVVAVVVGRLVLVCAALVRPLPLRRAAFATAFPPTLDVGRGVLLDTGQVVLGELGTILGELLGAVARRPGHRLGL